MITYVIRYIWDKFLNGLDDPFTATLFMLLVALLLSGALVGVILGLSWLLKVDFGIMLGIVIGSIAAISAIWLIGSIVREAIQSYKEQCQ